MWIGGVKMDNLIKDVWNVFKHEKNELFYLFYEENGNLNHEKISMNESKTSGEVDLNVLIRIAPFLSGKTVIAVHNHPDDKPTPSFPDFVQKKYLESILRLINVTLKDYVIVSAYGYISFADSGIHQYKSHFQCKQYDSVESVSLPLLMMSSLVKKNEADIKSLLGKHSEVIYTPSKQYASNCFPGDFLLANKEDFSSKTIYFCSGELSDSIMVRLRDINEVIEPNEIYHLVNNNLIPLKKNGIV